MVKKQPATTCAISDGNVDVYSNDFNNLYAMREDATRHACNLISQRTTDHRDKSVFRPKPMELEDWLDIAALNPRSTPSLTDMYRPSLTFNA